jgi:hypothetical protein
MAVLNSDRGTASTPLDHALPTMMLLDQAQFIATWNDSRSSLNNNLRYTVHNAFGFVTTSGLFENADSAMLGVGVTTPQEFTYFIFPRDHSDIVGSLGYRLHAHTMSEVDNSSTSRSISTISQIFSPYTYQTPPQ